MSKVPYEINFDLSIYVLIIFENFTELSIRT